MLKREKRLHCSRQRRRPHLLFALCKDSSSFVTLFCQISLLLIVDWWIFLRIPQQLVVLVKATNQRRSTRNNPSTTDFHRNGDNVNNNDEKDEEEFFGCKCLEGFKLSLRFHPRNSSFILLELLPQVCQPLSLLFSDLVPGI